MLFNVTYNDGMMVVLDAPSEEYVRSSLGDVLRVSDYESNPWEMWEEDPEPYWWEVD